MSTWQTIKNILIAMGVTLLIVVILYLSAIIITIFITGSMFAVIFVLLTAITEPKVNQEKGDQPEE